MCFVFLWLWNGEARTNQRLSHVLTDPFPWILCPGQLCPRCGHNCRASGPTITSLDKMTHFVDTLKRPCPVYAGLRATRP